MITLHFGECWYRSNDPEKADWWCCQELQSSPDSDQEIVYCSHNENPPCEINYCLGVNGF